jgi:succinate dehydrogenase subunit D
MDMSTSEIPALPKRAIAPVFWLLFGAGGMLAAFFGPALILLTGIMIPHGWGVREDLGSYANVLAFARSPFGKLMLLAIISLFFWHAAERLFLTLHDTRAGPIQLLRWITYGSAALLSVLVATVLLSIGF